MMPDLSETLFARINGELWHVHEEHDDYIIASSYDGDELEIDRDDVDEYELDVG